MATTPLMEIGRPTGASEALAVVRFLGTALYAALLIPIYIGLAQWWDYFGFAYTDPGMPALCLVVVLAALPALFLSQSIDTLPRFICWMIYLLLYVPAIIVPLLQNFIDFFKMATNLALVVTSAIGFAIAMGRPMPTAPYIPVKHHTFWVIAWGLYIFLNIYVIYVFGSTLSIATNDTVYDQRFLGSAAVGTSYVGYAIGALSNAINPFFVIIGISRKKWVVLAAGIAGQVIGFATLALRSTLISPLFIIGIYLIFNNNYRLSATRLILLYVSIALCCIPLMATYNPVSGLLGQLITLISMRTLLISGMTFGVYSEFFSIYPVTYFSHINGINLLVTYPYGVLQIGEVIGQYIAPTLTFEALGFNASFLASDGIGSLGSIGIPFITVIAVIVLRGMGRLTQAVDTRIVSAAYVPFIVNITNTSISTSLLTGGGALLTTLFFFWSCCERHDVTVDGKR